MKATLRIAVIFSFTLIVASCSRTYYAPNIQNVPLMENKGDATIAFSGGSLGKKDFQASYAVNNSIGVLLNHMRVADSYSKIEPGNMLFPRSHEYNLGNGYMTELGIGYYKDIGSNFKVELLGILGRGFMKNKFSGSSLQRNGSLSSSLTKYAFQANLGYHRKYFEIAFTVKPTFVKYSGIEGDLIFDEIDQFTFLNQNDNLFMVESALTIRLGFKSFKLQLQGGHSSLDSKSPFGQISRYVALGMFIDFNALGK